MSTIRSNPPTSRPGEPAWEIARIFPDQGHWNESDYLEATDSTNRLVELVRGQVQVLPMPTKSHQLILQFLFKLFDGFFAVKRLGEVCIAPLRVRLRSGLIREPDIVVMLAANADRAADDVWDGADLVVEIVSDDERSRHRDWVEKKREYAEAGIREYWVVDPQQQVIAVFTLPAGAREYATHGEFSPGAAASSVLLPGFEVSVQDALDAAKL